jgi:hypothetical protein
MDKLSNLLPDFEEIMTLLEDIKTLQFEKTLLELDIKVKVARVYLDATSESKYFIGGKPPSATFIKSTWEEIGFNNEILADRKRLVELGANLKYNENKLSTYRDMIDVWRTLSANERVTTL